MTTGKISRTAARSAALALAAVAIGPAAAAVEEDAAQVVVTGTLPPNLFGTVAVSASLSRYAADWERARRPASAMPAMQRLIAPARPLRREQQVAYIQSAVQKQVCWMSDTTAWGHHEYWASAAETLRLGCGDVEDRAILKMQALQALGWRPSQLILTIGQDKVWGQTTLLIVRLGPDWLLTLDDLGGPPVPIQRRVAFQPLISFSGGKSWLHGRRRAPEVALAPPRP